MLFAACPVLIVALKALHAEFCLLDITQRVIDPLILEIYFRFAKAFLWQNLGGVLVTAHLAGAMAIADDLDLLLAPVARFIRIAAGYTLSIYLLHFPIELMIAAILHSQPDGPIKTAAMITGALALAVSIGVFIEPQRHWLKSFLWLWFERLSKSMARRWDAPAPDPASAARDNSAAE